MPTPEEIRQTPAAITDHWLREIAAQLAELNETLKEAFEPAGLVSGRLNALCEIADLLKARDPEAHLPEECKKHECSYFTHYLMYGGPDLTHEGFHNAEKQADAHFKSCSRTNSAKECHVCFNWEKRVRA